MSDKKKQILPTIDNVRVIEADARNLEVQRLEDVHNVKEGTTTSRWRFKGYCNSVLSGLRMIQNKELLIDCNAITSLKSYLKQVEESNAKLIEKLEEMKQ